MNVKHVLFTAVIAIIAVAIVKRLPVVSAYV